MNVRIRLERALLQIAELEEKITVLEKDKKLLENELRKYQNPNTPPSAHPHLKPDSTPFGRRRKRGAPLNHQGATRPWKNADETREITARECPGCHSPDIRVIGQRHQQVEEMPPDIQPKVIDVAREVCQCNACHLKFQARDGRTPIQGRFGINLMVLTIFLKFIVRGVLRKTAGFLEAGFALRITPASVNAIITRASQAAEGEYEQLKQKIRVARIVYVDETSFSVLGAKWWVWVFRSDTDLLIVIRHDRGNPVVKEVLGVAFSGIVVCDGWRAYDCLSLASIQRCWAHLLRKSAELEEQSVAGRHFNEKLERLFKCIERFNRKPRTEEERLRKYGLLTVRLRETIRYYSGYPECGGVANYVGNRLGEWFTCVWLEGVEPTNNFAEQAIRETVVVRKIIGAFRSQGGARAYEKLASLLATWQFQRRDVAKELTRMLSTGLC
ncbi:MAG: IS66 family transposase [Candidatus Micrarchaeota archaeon]